jgi:hypothetical protein
MGKVIKNVVKTLVATFCGLLLAALVLPLVVSLLVSLPGIQNAIVRRLTERVSERLGTKISIDRVALKLINHVEIEGFYVEDFNGDTLMWVPRLTAPLEDAGLGRGQLAFGKVRLSGAKLLLRKARPEEDMNISRVVDSLLKGPSDPDSRFRMRVAAIEADSLTFGLWRGGREQRDRGVDFTRFVMSDVSVRIEDFAIAGDTIRMEINSLRGVERTGLVIDDLEAHPLIVSRGAVTLADVGIRSRGSRLALPSIRLVSADKEWADFSRFSDSVAMGITMRSSRVTTDLVGAFLPAVSGWGIALEDVALRTHGVLARFGGEIEHARTLGTTFALDFTSSGLPRYRDARFDVRLGRLESVGSDAAILVRSVTGREPSHGLSAILSRLGVIHATGEVAGGLSDFHAEAAMVSGAGYVDLSAKALTGEHNTRLEGRVSTPRLELGRLLGVDDIGTLSGDFTGSVELASGGVRSGVVHGDVRGVRFRDHTYTGISFDGTIDGRRYGVELIARDPALEADLRATLDRSGGVPGYTVDLDLGRGDLAAMQLDREDSVSVVSGRLTARMSGRGLDDANGRVELHDAVYRSQGGTVQTPLATLEARSDASGKLLALSSEFVDGEFRSRTGYRDMLSYLGGFLQRYIPLPVFGKEGVAASPYSETPEARNRSAAGVPTADPSNYSIVSVNVKNTERLFDALSPGTAIAEGTEARFMFNPYTGSFSLSARSGFVEWGGLLAADLEVTADNAADSLTLYLSGTDIYSGRGHIPRFELHGGAKGGRPRVDVALDGRMWRLAADSLGFAEGRMGLRNLRLSAADAPGQRLTATGVLSHLPSDTLHVRFNGFDISPLGRLVRGGGIDLAGRTTGWLDVAGVLENPKINADVELSDLSAGGHTAPPMRFVSRPADDGGVSFGLVNQTSGADLVRGTFSRSGEIDADVRIDEIDVGLLDPLLGDILEGTEGEASADLTIGGTLRRVRLDGHIDVPRLSTTVAYTRARYSVAGARLTLDGSVLTLPRTPVRSGVGGTGDISMRVDLSNLSDITTELEARTDGMLVFDTRPSDSEAFYGRVFATGTAFIRSGRMGTRMDISARSDAGTRFDLPLNAKSNVSWADFVVFARPDGPTADTTDVLARKRLAYERRLAGPAGGVRRRKPLELNLTASVTPAAEVHMLIDPNLGQGITGRGEGVIDMKIDPVNDIFTMTGDYNITSGRFEFSMMNVFNKTFEIAPGSTLRWSGAPDDALLSVDGSYRVRTSLLPLVGGAGGTGGAAGSLLVSDRPVPVDCIIRLRERLSDPEITFDISLPSAEPEQRQVVAGAMNTQELKSMQFLSLLTTGSFATDNSITGQMANSGMSTTGAVGFDILTNQLNNFLSSEDYDIYFRYRPQDNFATSQVDVGFSTGFWDNRIQLEIEGNYVDNRAATSVGTAAASDLAGDVSLTWVIDRAGNLRLKVFSQTIDRPNETQGLQESGLGIHYKRDFNSIGDIFRRGGRRSGDKFTTFARDSVDVETPRRRNNK